MEFIKATLADLDDLKSVATTTFKETYGPYNTAKDMELYFAKAMSRTELKDELTDSKQQVFFAKDQGKIIGYLKLKEGQAQDRFKDDPEALELERLYLLSAAQHAGAGSKMLDYVIEKAKQMHKRYLWLAVWEHNDTAQKFYAQHHFKQIARSDFVLGTQHEPGFLLKRDLTE